MVGILPPLLSLGGLVIASTRAFVAEYPAEGLSLTRAAIIGGEEHGSNIGSNIVGGNNHTHSRSHRRDAARGPTRLVFPTYTAVAYLYVGKGTDGTYSLPGQEPQPLAFVEERIRIPTRAPTIWRTSTSPAASFSFASVGSRATSGIASLMANKPVKTLSPTLPTR